MSTLARNPSPEERQRQHLTWLQENATSGRAAEMRKAYATGGRGVWFAEFGTPRNQPQTKVIYILQKDLGKLPAGESRDVVTRMVETYDPERQFVVALEDEGTISAYKLHLEPAISQGTPGRTLAAREVLDMHADLQRVMARPSPSLRRLLLDYGKFDAEREPRWAASHLHLHPATSWDDLQPWLDSLGADLFGAVTYQVTAEMVELADALLETTPSPDVLTDDELPAPWGFMWLDKPIPRPSSDDNGEPPLQMHAVSWARVPAMQVAVEGERDIRTVPGIRIREWGYDDSPDTEPRPLHLMGQSMVPLAGGYRTPLTEHWTLHMLWILMGMEIVTADAEEPGRAGRKRAANLRHQTVRVVRLRRSRHGEPEGGHRRVDWSCSWLVRGHWRNAPHGGTFADGRARTWVKAYIKGPDGLPLRGSDILYRLSR